MRARPVRPSFSLARFVLLQAHPLCVIPRKGLRAGAQAPPRRSPPIFRFLSGFLRFAARFSRVVCCPAPLSVRLSAPVTAAGSPPGSLPAPLFCAGRAGATALPRFAGASGGLRPPPSAGFARLDLRKWCFFVCLIPFTVATQFHFLHISHLDFSVGHRYNFFEVIFMTKGNPRVTLRFTKEQLARLKEAAAKRNLSVSELIREAIRLYFLAEYK